MDVRVRKTRTLKVTEVKISEEECELLAQLYKDSRYQALLNVMERACIEMESAHFSVPMGDPESILGGFAVAKACWYFFTYVQRQVHNCFSSRAADEEEGPIEPPTLEEFIQSVE
jgi:hypothetical protein